MIYRDNDHVPLLAYLEDTVRFEDGQVVLLSRKLYPEETSYMRYDTYQGVAQAIEEMVVQGAIVIAMAAGYGFALGLQNYNGPAAGLDEYAQQVYERLLATRPTGQRLRVILDKCLALVQDRLQEGETDHDALAKAVRQLIWDEIGIANEIAVRCGEYTAQLLDDGDRVLTHCFADSALIHMLVAAQHMGKTVEMFCTETRPYLQGARLTAASIRDTGTPVTLVTDNMPGFLIQQGLVTKLITAADTITMDGYVCNKVGTYQYAVVAQHHNIPFYVLGYEGPDRHTASHEDIEIEYRDPEEVFYCRGVRTAVSGIDGLYPAFDIVSPNFVTAITTDRGIYSPANIADYHREDENQ